MTDRTDRDEAAAPARRQIMERDAAIYAAEGDYPEFEAIAEHKLAPGDLMLERPTLYSIPLTAEDLAELNAGRVVRVDAPVDAEEGFTEPTIFMIRPPRRSDLL